MKKKVSIRAVLIVVLVIACGLAAVIPMITVKAEPDAGAAKGPDRQYVQGMQLTFSALAVRTDDSIRTIVKSEQDKQEVSEADKASALQKARQARQKAQEKKQAVQTAPIQGNGTPIMGTSSVTADKMAALYREKASYPAKALKKGGAGSIEEFCDIIAEEAEAEGVRADVVFAQAMVETGWLRFRGSDSITQYNFAGLGTVGDGKPGNSFPDVRTGIRAQVQHLKAYACTDELNGAKVDKRFDKVKRGCAPYIEWLGMQENPQGLGWASGEDYGNKLLKIISDMQSL